MTNKVFEFSKIYQEFSKEEDEFLLFNAVKEETIKNLFELEKRLKPPYKENIRRQRNILTNNEFNEYIHYEIYTNKNNRFKAIKEACKTFLTKDNKTYLADLEDNLTVIMLNEIIDNLADDVILIMDEINCFYASNLTNKVKGIITIKKLTCQNTFKKLAKRKIVYLNDQNKTNETSVEEQPESFYQASSSLNNLNYFNNKNGFYDNLLNNSNQTTNIKLTNFSKDKHYFYLNNIEEEEFNLFGPFQTIYFEELQAILKAHYLYKNAQIVIPTVYDITQYNHIVESIELINNQIGNNLKIKVGIIMDCKKHYQKLINFRKVDFIYLDAASVIKSLLEIEEDELSYYHEEVNELFKEMTSYFFKNKIDYYVKRDFMKYINQNKLNYQIKTY